MCVAHHAPDHHHRRHGRRSARPDGVHPTEGFDVSAATTDDMELMEGAIRDRTG
jgi:hypothetical protein